MLNEMTKHEAALESFAVAAWQEAEGRDTSAAWFRVYEHLIAVQAYLSRLHFDPLAKMASDLKVLAVLRGEMCPDYAHQMAFKAKSNPLPLTQYAF
jgi:hypothetical protein